MSRYEEQVKKNQKDLKNKDAVIESLKADAERRLSKKDETIAAQANEIKDSTEENALLRNELSKYRQKEAEALEKKRRRQNIFRLIWSVLWKLVVLAGVTVLLLHFKNKYNSEILTYISTAVDIVGLIITFWSALKQNKEYLFTKKQK